MAMLVIGGVDRDKERSWHSEGVLRWISSSTVSGVPKASTCYLHYAGKNIPDGRDSDKLFKVQEAMSSVPNSSKLLKLESDTNQR